MGKRVSLWGTLCILTYACPNWIGCPSRLKKLGEEREYKKAGINWLVKGIEGSNEHKNNILKMLSPEPLRNMSCILPLVVRRDGRSGLGEPA